jgi:hypothetical protein
VDLVESPTSHGYPKQQREAMARWMRRWLLETDDAVTEGDFAIAKDADLYCTRTGQVLEDLKGVSAFDLNALRADQLQNARNLRQVPPPGQQQAEVRRLLGLPGTIRPAAVKELGEVKRDGHVIRRLLFEAEAGMPVPGLLFEAGKGPLVVYLHEGGKGADAGPGGPIEKLVRDGKRVLALDLRGTGETAPGKLSPEKPGQFGVDFKEAFLALHLNRPLVGQKALDLLAVVAKAAPEGCSVVAVGSVGPAALHAAALEPLIREVTVERSLASWDAVARTPLTVNQLTNVVPGALAVYDLPELAGLIAPRPLTIRNAVDAQGKPVTQAALEEAYRGARAGYERAGAPKSLTLRQE